MDFYNRTNELDIINTMKERSRNEAQMTVLMGRRRIGKTELARRCNDETLLYFFVARKTETLLCQDFVREAEDRLGIPIGWPTSFSELFRYLLVYAETHPFTLVIDEFQEFQRVNPSIFSDMQRDWDLHKHTSRMNLIISGSVFSLMKHIFEDAKEPLFGRANQSLLLTLFTTDVLKQILADHNPYYTPDDLLTLFAVTGGVPWYVALLMDNGKTDRNSILSYLTEVNSPFINEGKNILIEEFGSDYAMHFSILTCLAGGQQTRGEIESQLGANNIGSYLVRLENYYGLIEKKLPIFAKENAKKVRYALNDRFLDFWFRFFYKYQNYVANNALGQLARIIERDFDTYSGFALERYFEQKFREKGYYTRIGKFWDRKGTNEIDLIAVNEIDGIAEVYEIKRDTRRYDEKALKDKIEVLLQNSPQLHGMNLQWGVLSLEDL
ncbi:MAG: ATP-binding protein [Bacteroidales bacterium]|nr:ATP-binding protein [Bacteroidales bacterium]